MPAERLRVACVQMDMRLGDTDGNFAHAEELVRAAVEREHPDVVVLPETWNTGFFPEDLSACADRDGMRTKETFSRLAKELHVHVVAGSVADRRDGRFYNTAYVFDRTGALVTSYDKTHAFTPMGEQLAFAQGDALCRFSLEGHDCGLIICYDIRFPELTRTLALQGMGERRNVFRRTFHPGSQTSSRGHLPLGEGINFLVMITFPPAEDGHGPYGTVLAEQGLAVFDS